MPAELVGATGRGRAATAQVRRPLTNREVEALDERRAGFRNPPTESARPSSDSPCQPSTPLDPDDTIVPPSLEHLTIDAR